MPKATLTTGQINNVKYEIIRETWPTKEGVTKEKYLIRMWSDEYEYQGRTCKDYTFEVEPAFPATVAAIYAKAQKVTSPTMFERVQRVDPLEADDLPPL